MAAQGKEVLVGFLIGKDVISSAWKVKFAIKKKKEKSIWKYNVDF